MLAEHKGRVTVKVLGLAASAASVVAMAGDEIQIAKSGFFMLHNAWIIGAGNRHDFRALAEYLEPFDRAMRDLYADATGEDPKTVEKWLDDETWFGSGEAIEKGLATSTLEDPAESDEPSEIVNNAAMRQIDKYMAKGGLTRAKRRELLAKYKESLETVTPGANGNEDDMLRAIDFTGVNQTLKQLRSVL